MKKLLPLLLILIFAFSAYSQTATVTAKTAQMRGTASSTGKIIDTVSQNTVLPIYRELGDWALVQSTEYVGWIHISAIKINDQQTIESVGSTVEDSLPAPRLRTNSNNIRLKSQPSSPSRSYIRGKRGGCYYVNSNGNKTYVDRSLCN
jgi:hypothetical protein